MGNSIHYSAMTEMYDELKEDRVFINKNMNPDYPLMANAIYSEDEMQIIMMVWGNSVVQTGDRNEGLYAWNPERFKDEE